MCFSNTLFTAGHASATSAFLTTLACQLPLAVPSQMVAPSVAHAMVPPGAHAVAPVASGSSSGGGCSTNNGAFATIDDAIASGTTISGSCCDDTSTAATASSCASGGRNDHRCSQGERVQTLVDGALENFDL